MLDARQLGRIVIAGGGTAGWMTAAAFAHTLRDRYRIELVESDEIGTVGVGEATIPMIQRYNSALGIEEDEFLRATQGTFKLGVEFVGWHRPGESYLHGFGQIGQDLGVLTFDKYWQRQALLGRAAPLGEYILAVSAARAGKFMRPVTDRPQSPLAGITYAFQFDASLYARYLRRRAEAQGVIRTEGRIVDVTLRASDGFVESLTLADGRRVAGDLFIDCTGFAGLLIERQLATGFEDWSRWLPCDRALAVPSAADAAPLPCTRATARAAGWQWRIPLQHRTGNGHVYASACMSDEEAYAVLTANLGGPPLAEPRPLRFRAGMRARAWNRNVIAIGLAGGFLEPIESTSIHLIQTVVARLLEFFPDRGCEPRDIAEFNRQVRIEYEGIRDFLIAHYKLNERPEPFWRQCAAMVIPESLERRLELFRSHGRVYREGFELFTEVSWVQVLTGQGVRPDAPHPLTLLLEERELTHYLEQVRAVIARCVDLMPRHVDFIAAHCRAPGAPVP